MVTRPTGWAVGSFRLALKIDVDTERGTRLGVPALMRILAEAGVPATFFFSLGPDNTGRALRRLFRPGFASKVARTNVLAHYGLRTLLNGVLWPGPKIARRHAPILRAVARNGFGVAVHCWDHVRWQDGLRKMRADEVHGELARAFEAFESVFGARPTAAGAAGWQANSFSLAAYDDARLLWASDTRGRTPFFPCAGGRVFRTPQLPTTLPTLDELLGRREHPRVGLAERLLDGLRPDALEVMTLHAELEGQREQGFLREVLDAARSRGVELVRLEDEVTRLRVQMDAIPICELEEDGSVLGRSGTLAAQGPTLGPGAAPVL